jgi:ribonuclease D
VLRGVDEQVVLPGHCLQDLVDLDGTDLDAIAAVRGMGQKRYRLYGAALAVVLAPPPLAESGAQAVVEESKP